MNCKYFNYTLFYHIPIIFLIFNVISVDFCVSHGCTLMFSFEISQICISLIHGRTQNISASFHRNAELLIQFSCFNRNSGYFWALLTARSCNKLVVGWWLYMFMETWCQWFFQWYLYKMEWFCHSFSVQYHQSWREHQKERWLKWLLYCGLGIINKCCIANHRVGVPKLKNWEHLLF